MARECQMIDPFVDDQVRAGVISYGVSSYGYDVRVGDEFKVFTNVYNTVVDPKASTPIVRRHQGRRLHHSAELVRAGQHHGVLPHPARHPHGVPGQVDLRALRDHRQRHAVRAGVGRARDDRDLEHDAAAGEDLRQRGHRQVLFFQADEVCARSYKDKKGKYQAQRGVTLPRL
jgi:dCTP deaminase